MLKHPHGYISLAISLLALVITSALYVIFPTPTEAEKINDSLTTTEASQQPKRENYVVINLNTNTLTLHDTNRIVRVLPLVSQGKPGSYYETIGGEYISDYKEPLHFSSIGHVYMPFSIHLFGNYFIHGIPYYPDGTKVSTAYSGGCIRLSDNDAKHVYDFITATTSIIITRGNENDFTPTKSSTTTISSMYMTRLMVATISLELLTQDNIIWNTQGIATTRKKLIPSLLAHEYINTGTLYADTINNKTFIEAMNSKAKSLGLTNTMFTGVNDPVITTDEDYGRFMGHIVTYKSYLQKVETLGTTD